MGSNDKTKDAKEATQALRLRATTMAQRLENAAALGGPALEKLSARVYGKLKGVPENRIVQPPANIEAPTALHYMLLGDGDEVAELREMFENLLASSMDRETAASAHPAFVSMISQLTPDEARILKSIDRDDYAFVNVYELDPGGSRRTLDSRTLLGIGIGIDKARQQQYISNLDRLGILRFSTRSSSDIDGHKRLVAAIEAEFSSRHVSSSNDSIGLTPLGRQFLNTCVRAREPH